MPTMTIPVPSHAGRLMGIPRFKSPDGVAGAVAVGLFVGGTAWVAVSVTVSVGVHAGVDVTVAVAAVVVSLLLPEATFTMTNSASRAAGIINHASLLLCAAAGVGGGGGGGGGGGEGVGDGGGGGGGCGADRGAVWARAALAACREALGIASSNAACHSPKSGRRPGAAVSVSAITEANHAGTDPGRRAGSRTS